jgi:hypothetical protein
MAKTIYLAKERFLRRDPGERKPDDEDYYIQPGEEVDLSHASDGQIKRMLVMGQIEIAPEPQPKARAAAARKDDAPAADAGTGAEEK